MNFTLPFTGWSIEVDKADKVNHYSNITWYSSITLCPPPKSTENIESTKQGDIWQPSGKQKLHVGDIVNVYEGGKDYYSIVLFSHGESAVSYGMYILPVKESDVEAKFETKYQFPQERMMAAATTLSSSSSFFHQ
jgi:hypothetical protein